MTKKKLQHILPSQYRKGTALTYQGVLDALGSELWAANNWASSKNYDRAAKYQIRAEALTELLEVHNCGAVGGFDEGQESVNSLDLEDRWHWLVSKTPKPISLSCNAKLLDERELVDWLQDRLYTNSRIVGGGNDYIIFEQGNKMFEIKVQRIK